MRSKKATLIVQTSKHLVCLFDISYSSRFIGREERALLHGNRAALVFNDRITAMRLSE